jgi:thiosulfate/3-mercaptopyruvate sulfurtransferase
MHNTIISAQRLLAEYTQAWVLLDCRFSLEDPSQGEQQYRAAHLPGAHYMHLDYHLSGVKTGSNGRHPLPDAQRLAVDFGAQGIGPKTQVVTYDDSGGMFAARAWWLLRWLGHEHVAVLDGGLSAWLDAGGKTESSPPARHTQRFALRPKLASSVSASDIEANLETARFTVVDARSPERFRGQNETLDPAGGHIPGALNRFYRDNLGPDGCFKSPERLRQEWQALLGNESSGLNIVHQCGSGVTACVNLLAMEIAGLGGSRLYPGSWSEWCANPAHPISTE